MILGQPKKISKTAENILTRRCSGSLNNDAYTQVYDEIDKNLKKFIMKKSLLLLLFFILCLSCSASSDYSLFDDNISAACKGDIAKLRSLLKKDPSLLYSKDKVGATLLHFVSKFGSKESVEFLISQGARVNEKNDRGETPLHAASMYDNVNTIKVLISKGADINAKDSDGMTPLCHAIKWRRKNAVNELLVYGADTNTIDKLGKTPLSISVELDKLDQCFPFHSNRKEIIKALLAHGAKGDSTTEAIISKFIDTTDSLTDDITTAALKGDIEKLRNFLNKEPSLVNDRDKEGVTLLRYASGGGSEEAVEFLISRGARVDEKDDFGETPSHAAIEHNYIRIIKLLLSRGADPNARFFDGKTPMHFTVEFNRKEAVELLLAHGADINATDERGKTPLSTVVEMHDWMERSFPPHSDRKEMVNFLFAHGARINNLTEAIAAGDLDTIKALIASDPKLLNSTKQPETPLWNAAYWDRKEVAELLISLGANVYKVESALDVSSMNGSTGITKLLISKGAEVNPPGRNFISPLYNTVQFGKNQFYYCGWTDRDGKKIRIISSIDNPNSAEEYIKVAKLLISAGADVNAKYHNRTPLYIAVIKSWKEMAELLISAGADVNSRNEDLQSTPLHIAAEDGNKDIVELLITKGADINAKDKDGKTPLKLALENGRKVIVDLLHRHGARE